LGGWRNDYVVSATESERTGEDDACVFCGSPPARPEPDNGVCARPSDAVVLNLYPYASGHLLASAAPPGDLEELDAAEAAELWTVRLECALRAAYAPDGINIGANLGGQRGGIPAHLICTPCPMVGRHHLHDSVAGAR